MNEAQKDLVEVKPNKSFFRIVIWFIGWGCLAICAFILIGLGSIYIPCFMGEQGSCISGVFLLMGSLLILVFGVVGLFALLFTRRRNNID